MISYISRYILLVMLLLPLEVAAQYNMLFTSDYDTPNSLVNKIAEDSHGMVWIASEYGLGRYNGSRFEAYYSNKGDKHSLSNNFVRTIYTGDDGTVIVGGIGGVQVYRPQTNDFTEPLVSKKDGVSQDNVNDITRQNDGSLLVSGGVSFTLRKAPSTGSGQVQWKVEKNVLTGRVKDAFRAIQTKDGNMWVAQISDDVLCVSPDGRIRKVRTEGGGVCHATAFCIAPDGRLYVGTFDSGVYVYSKLGSFHQIAGTEKMDAVYDIQVKPGTSTLYVATDGGGVNMIDSRTGKMLSSQQFDDPLMDISTAKVHSLYINRNGDVWSALYQKGIFMATHAVNVFSYIGHRSARYNLIGDKCVISLLQTHDGNIWATTDNGGLYGFTSSLTSIRKYPASTRIAGGVPTTMLGLFEDSRHRVWFGSYAGGGGTVDLSTGICHYIPIKGLTGRDYSIFGYAEDKRGGVWANSMGNGILRYDEKRKVFVTYMGPSTSFGQVTQWTNTIFYDAPHDRMYCGTYSGVISFSASNFTLNTSLHFARLQKPTLSGYQQIAPNSVVYAISRISGSQIACASNMGLILIDLGTGRSRIITTDDGLPTNNVYAVRMGNDGHLWISSTSGLTRLNLKDMTSETYTMRDGLQGNEFYKNTAIMTQDGRLLFGGINGITIFQPRDVDRYHVGRCKVRVVDVFVGDTYITADDDGEYLIPVGNESFTVSFATLPLYMSHRVTYFYRMDGGGWEILPAPQNKIAFDNLEYGSHTLEVKTVIDGKDTDISETQIYVQYPWFLRWWMVIVWLILLSVIAYYIYRSVQRRRKVREHFRQAQQEQKLKETKLQFFMNIVHDLRTPLTLIATPLQKLQKTDEDATRQHLYDIMHRNTDRLLNLTNDIMDLRKLDSGKMELNPLRALVSKLIRVLVGSMSDMAETRNQQIVLTDHTDGDQYLMIDAEKFSQILSNLLSNAMKYTPEGGRIEVEWSIIDADVNLNANQSSSTSSSTLVVSVTDNGMGIPDEEKKRIFERFYQVRTGDKHIKGTGIGLNLVKSLVELHNGKITVTDNPEGQGTRFTVILPAVKNPSTGSGQAENENKSNTETQRHRGDFNLNANPCVQSSTSKSRHTILIVDDDDDIRNFLKEELSEHFNVLEASNGRIAYDILNKSSASLVVSDIMMPEIDGIELVRMIRKNIRLSHLPVILLTAKASDQDHLEGFQATADAYVTKPFNMELLETFIINMIVRQNKLRNTFSGNTLPADRIEMPEVESADDKLMERILKVINANLDNPDFTSEILAREVGLSRVHMYRKLKELTNQSATNYIRNIRLTKAAEILRQGKSNISEVAYMVGFRTPAHFSTAFKELYGMTPKEYMRS